MKNLTFLIPILLCQLSFSQSNFKWQNYLPGQEVDSILFLKTQGESLSKPLDSYLWKLIRENKIPNQKNIDSLAVHYPIQNSITDGAIIREFISFCPKDSCEYYSVGRCGAPIYRDAIVFYKDKKPVYFLLVCFQCKSTDSLPASRRASCLVNEFGDFEAFVSYYFTDKNMYKMYQEEKEKN